MSFSRVSMSQSVLFSFLILAVGCANEVTMRSINHLSEPSHLTIQDDDANAYGDQADDVKGNIDVADASSDESDHQELPTLPPAPGANPGASPGAGKPALDKPVAHDTSDAVGICLDGAKTACTDPAKPKPAADLDKPHKLPMLPAKPVDEADLDADDEFCRDEKPMKFFCPVVSDNHVSVIKSEKNASSTAFETKHSLKADRMYLAKFTGVSKTHNIDLRASRLCVRISGAKKLVRIDTRSAISIDSLRVVGRGADSSVEILVAPSKEADLAAAFDADIKGNFKNIKFIGASKALCDAVASKVSLSHKATLSCE